MEEECHRLDMLIASHKATVLPGTATSLFEKRCRAHKRLHQLRDELNSQQQQASFLEQTLTLLALNLPSDQVQQSSQLEIVRQEAKRSRELIKQLVSSQTKPHNT